MDAVAPSAIRTAAPSAPLTEGYATTTLDLQFSFYNNSEPQEPPQKPKVVPVGTAQAPSGGHVDEPGEAGTAELFLAKTPLQLNLLLVPYNWLYDLSVCCSFQARS